MHSRPLWPHEQSPEQLGGITQKEGSVTPHNDQDQTSLSSYVGQETVTVVYFWIWRSVFMMMEWVWAQTLRNETRAARSILSGDLSLLHWQKIDPLQQSQPSDQSPAMRNPISGSDGRLHHNRCYLQLPAQRGDVFPFRCDGASR